MAGENKDLTPLFDLITRHVPDPEPIQTKDEPFAFLVTMIDSDPFLGRMLTGRVEVGPRESWRSGARAVARRQGNRKRPPHQTARRSAA